MLGSVECAAIDGRGATESTHGQTSNPLPCIKTRVGLRQGRAASAQFHRRSGCPLTLAPSGLLAGPHPSTSQSGRGCRLGLIWSRMLPTWAETIDFGQKGTVHRKWAKNGALPSPNRRGFLAIPLAGPKPHSAWIFTLVCPRRTSRLSLCRRRSCAGKAVDVAGNSCSGGRRLFHIFSFGDPAAAPVVPAHFSIASFISLSHFSLGSYPTPFSRTTPFVSTIQFWGMPTTFSVSFT